MMNLFKLIAFSLVGAAVAVPKGYILNVQHDCGSFVNGKGTGASVKIVSDLHTIGKLTCSDNASLPVDIDMPLIKDDDVTSVTELFYPGDDKGVDGEDCFFFHPSAESNLYVVKLAVYWGFNKAKVMENSEIYTISCTAEGHATQELNSRKVDDSLIELTDGFVQNLGDDYLGSSSLELMDVLDNPIEDDSVPLGKLVYLKLTVSGGSEQGLTPYDCYAKSQASKISFKLLNAGCGDGVIFNKDQGFTVKGTTATSPLFKTFKIFGESGTVGNIAQVKYKCSFTTCNQTCDGSSCSLPVRRKRGTSPDDGTTMRIVYSSLPDLDIKETCSIPNLPLFTVAAFSLCIVVFGLYICLQRQNFKTCSYGK